MKALQVMREREARSEEEREVERKEGGAAVDESRHTEEKQEKGKRCRGKESERKMRRETKWSDRLSRYVLHIACLARQQLWRDRNFNIRLQCIRRSAHRNVLLRIHNTQREVLYLKRLREINELQNSRRKQ